MLQKTRARRPIPGRDFAFRLERLCRLASEVAALGDEDETLQAVVDTAAAVVGVPAAHLALVDRGRKGLYGVVSSGRHRKKAPRACFELHRGQAAYTALREKRPVLISRAAHDRRVNPDARVRLSIGAAAYVPLLAAGDSFGLLILATPGPHVWTSQERRLAIHVAGVAAVALQTTRLLNQLAETDGTLRNLIEDIPAVVYTCEVEFPFRTLSIGPQIHAILGYPSRDWLNDPDLFFKLVHPDDHDRLMEQATEALAGRGFMRSEYRMLDRGGNIRWFRDEAVLVRDPAGKPLAWHGVLVEITRVREMSTGAETDPWAGPPGAAPPTTSRS